jgi:hypothetical protein
VFMLKETGSIHAPPRRHRSSLQFARPYTVSSPA